MEYAVRITRRWPETINLRMLLLLVYLLLLFFRAGGWWYGICDMYMATSPSFCGVRVDRGSGLHFAVRALAACAPLPAPRRLATPGLWFVVVFFSY